ncbi:MAG: hypothetical protein KA419_06700 [Acidobacteria bacterium]|nr:hypothetical protein [Acidobacteriota bacterium]
MQRMNLEEKRKERLLQIISRHAHGFKYELTRLHLNENQIEVIYPFVVKLIDTVNREYLAEEASGWADPPAP